MINKKIIKAIGDDKFGLSLTELVSETKLSRGQIRIAVAFLLGSKQIEEHQVGMAKIYCLKVVEK